MLPRFELVRPTTVAEAVAAVSEDRLPYCGGTELLMTMRMGLQRPDALVDLKRISELNGIREEDGCIAIGSATTHLRVHSDELVGRRLPMLASVESAVGNARVRAQGTVGGNLCFAEPKSDLAAALVALDATVRLVSPRGERELTVQDFVLGAYETDKEPDELLTAVRVPTGEHRRAVYLKYQTMERPTVGVAIVDDLDRQRCRVVLGAVSENPVVVDCASPLEIDPASVTEGIEPIEDLTGSERYKRHVAEIYLRRAIAVLTKGSAR